MQYYHRTISEYLNVFSPFFQLSEMQEISDDGETFINVGLVSGGTGINIIPEKIFYNISQMLDIIRKNNIDIVRP